MHLFKLKIFSAVFSKSNKMIISLGIHVVLKFWNLSISDIERSRVQILIICNLLSMFEMNTSIKVLALI